MRIAIDARGISWYRGTGIGTYTNNLVNSLLKIDRENTYNLYWSGENFQEFRKNNSKIIMTSNKHHRFFEQYYFPRNLDYEKVDIYHIPQNGIGLNSYIHCKKVVTIHDLIPFLMPHTVGRGYLLKFLKQMPSIIEKSDAIITVSEWSKKDILRFFPMDPNKVHVTPLATDLKYKVLDKIKCKNTLSKKYNINSPFILYIGGFSPRKNVKMLVKAFKETYNDLPQKYKLVIVGSYKGEGNEILKLVEDLNLSQYVTFTGFVDEVDLPLFYNACSVFVYPSLYEGFGLPPLEAISCGAPTISSDTTSIPEVLKDCGILINPNNLHELRDAIGKVLTNNNLRNNMIKKGLKRSSEFSWDKTANKTLNVYRSLKNK